METKHTPAPWSIHGKNLDGHTLIGSKENQTGKICHVRYNGDVNEEEQQANAKLIAAAPELLKNLTELLESYKMYIKNPEKSEFVINAEQAIKKATL